MDSLLAQQRKAASNPYGISPANKYRQASLNDQLVRSYGPLDVDQGLHEQQYSSQWPLTPPSAMSSVQSSIRSSAPETPFSAYTLPDDYPGVPVWESLGHLSGGGMSMNTLNMPTTFDSPVDGGQSQWTSVEDASLTLQAVTSWNKPTKQEYAGVMVRNNDPDMAQFGTAYGTPVDEVALIEPLSQYHPPPPPVDNSDAYSVDNALSRRPSIAASSISNGDYLLPSDFSFEDFSSSYEPTLVTDYSSRSSLALSANTPLSPVLSPRQQIVAPVPTRPEIGVARSLSACRASSSPRQSARTAPYSVDGGRNKRWSTGSVVSGSVMTQGFVGRRYSPFHPQPGMEAYAPMPAQPRFQPHQVMNAQPHQITNFSVLPSQHPTFRPQGMLPNQPFLESHNLDHLSHPGPHFNHTLFRMLASNADPMSLHYGDLTDPPDLYASLSEEPLPPPESDMNPSDPDAKPHEQDLRFEGDLYTPRWVRNHGNRREGWCGICKPGRWLVLKNSAFWYDKSFTHGISAATGRPFVEPREVRRMDGNPDVWEGLCHQCAEWVPLVSNKKKGTTWFRHAYKCHSHPKIKDAPKRRRESTFGRGRVKEITDEEEADLANGSREETSCSDGCDDHHH